MKVHDLSPTSACMSLAIRAVFIGTGALIVVFGLYAGCYFAMLGGKVYRPTGIEPITRQNLFEAEPRYHFAHPVMVRALNPAHRVDRWFRREFWITIEHSSGAKWSNPPAEESQISD